MKAIHTSIKTALLVVAASVLTAAFARADTYSWENLQSDIPGVAAHVDPNLVNPWGMAVGSTGIIWVADNGTGVSTLYYNQDGTAVPLVVAIPATPNRQSNWDRLQQHRVSSRSRKMGIHSPAYLFS